MTDIDMAAETTETRKNLHGGPDLARVGVDLLEYLSTKGPDAHDAHIATDAAVLLTDDLSCPNCREDSLGWLSTLISKGGKKFAFTLIMSLATIALTADKRIQGALAIIEAGGDYPQELIDALTGADRKDGMRNADGS